MSDLEATGGVPGPGNIGRVAVGDMLRRSARRFTTMGTRSPGTAIGGWIITTSRRMWNDSISA